jgi:hypothetical protein
MTLKSDSLVLLARAAVEANRDWRAAPVSTHFVTFRQCAEACTAVGLDQIHTPAVKALVENGGLGWAEMVATSAAQEA